MNTFFTIWLSCSVIAFVLLKPWRPYKPRRPVTIGRFVSAAIASVAVGPIIVFGLICEIRLY